MRITSIVSLGAVLLFVSRGSEAQPLQVAHRNGLLSIECRDASLSTVFERIENETGIELTLEDEVKAKKLTANLVELPVAMAVARLLEGVGVNYIVMMDSSDWARVDKIFVGAGGGGPARAAGQVRGPVVPEEPAEEAFEEAPPESFEDGMEGAPDDMGDAMDPGVEAAPEDMPQNPDEFGGGEDPGAFGGPPGSSPLPDYLPPAQQFPKSSFTPGLPRTNQRPQGSMAPQQQTPQQAPGDVPPATFPFTDPFGRPIPVPPGMNQQKQQQQKRQQQQQQQQQ